MASPTTLRGELLRERRTFNDRFFLTLGDSTAGMSPYNPLQLGLGVTLRINTNNHVNSVRMTLRRVTDGTSEAPGIITVTQVSDSEWKAEGAIGGVRLGFPQPPPDYHIPQCFELTLTIRNRGRSDSRVYNFWVGEGPVGSITECIDRNLVGAKPLICCFDGLGFRDPFFAFDDEFAEFFARNFDPAMSCLEDEGEALLPDPLEGVYVEGLIDPLEINFAVAPENPWVRDIEPAPSSPYPIRAMASTFSFNDFDQTGTPILGSVPLFDFPPIGDALYTRPHTLDNGKAWFWNPLAPVIDATVNWLVSPLLNLRYHKNARLEFYYWEDFDLIGFAATKMQWTQDEGNTWTDFLPGDFNVPLKPVVVLIVFGGGTDGLDVADETLTRIEVDLSQFDGTVNTRFRFAMVATGILPGDPPAGPIISGVTLFADDGEIVCAENAHARVLLGHGAQYKYVTVIPEEKEQQGRLNVAPNLAPAPPPVVVVPPALGSGVVNKINLNIQVANDIGGDPGGPNIGFPRGTTGPEITLVSNDDFGPDPNLFEFDIHLPSWVSGVLWNFFVVAGYWVRWDGLTPGTVFHIPTQNELAASLQLARSWGVPDGGGLWVPLGPAGAAIAIAPGATHRFTITQTGSGIAWNPFEIGVIFGVYVIMWDAAGPAPSFIVVPPSLLRRLYPDNSLRSNLLQFVVVV